MEIFSRKSFLILLWIATFTAAMVTATIISFTTALYSIFMVTGIVELINNFVEKMKVRQNTETKAVDRSRDLPRSHEKLPKLRL